MNQNKFFQKFEDQSMYFFSIGFKIIVLIISFKDIMCNLILILN